MSTTPLIDSLAIAHLDFQPGCGIEIRGGCDQVADYFIITHGCYVIEALSVEWADLLVCKGHLERCRSEWDRWVSRGQMLRCFYCNKVFSTFSDLVKTVVPL